MKREDATKKSHSIVLTTISSTVNQLISEAKELLDRILHKQTNIKQTNNVQQGVRKIKMECATKEIHSIALSKNSQEVKKLIAERKKMLEQKKHEERYKELRKAVAIAYNAQQDYYFNKAWIRFSVKLGASSYSRTIFYWHRETELVVPVLDNYSLDNTEYNNRLHCLYSLPILIPTLGDIKKLFGRGSNCPGDIWKGLYKSNTPTWKLDRWIDYAQGTYNLETGEFKTNKAYKAIRLFVCKLNKHNFKEKVCSGEYLILDDDLLLKAMNVLNQRRIQYIPERDIDLLATIFNIHINTTDNGEQEQDLNDIEVPEENSETYIKRLLECDYRRVELRPYDRQCLYDVNRGHWELWDLPEQAGESARINLPKPLIARNPISDIQYNGLIGIDFGTKSTVVSVQNGQEHITLLRVGTGSLNEAPKASHYENPTIMEFIHLDKFLKDYGKKKGRPETSITDLAISHKADNELKGRRNNEYFDSFFTEIKQWCGNGSRIIRIIDEKNNRKELLPFVSLSGEDFNPLEVYAYYLGLYINNMYEKIYLDYVLSFPVTYDLDVKNKIRESFEAGLWKSLPETVQNDEETAQRFRVRIGVSEPAAYAITALQGYGFTPQDKDEKYFYAIFDFGGGTSDFDFGIWRGADYKKREEEDKDYVIEHISNDGDRYLGGENLLELLAFSIFKANSDFMRTGKSGGKESVGFSFTLPDGVIRPDGSEAIINDSPSAKRNTKQLMEVLRPFWEGIIGIDNEKNKATKAETISYHGYVFRKDEAYKFPIDDEMIKVDLFDNNGERQQAQTLYIQKQNELLVDLIGILEKRIEKGVEQFFAALMHAFGYDIVQNSMAGKIHIFLAGNSSKSPILKKLFEQHIGRINEEINQKHNLNANTNHFELFPPLGTAEAKIIQKERGIEPDTSITAPTGKTGVAYGLIYGREGGPIKVISKANAGDQAKFKFNIGKIRRNAFSMVLDRHEAVYGKWVRFGPANSDRFDIYYTSSPSAAKQIPVTDPSVHLIRCHIPEADKDKDIYIRTIEEAPEEIEYCVFAQGEKPDETVKATRMHLTE
ncbi:hypothetical protein IJT17_05420 [bacterium]|nr:hypothetical protein [bacterium]